MKFIGTEQECAEVIAELDVSHGYPRGYTEEDVTAGRVVRHGRGPHAPIESIRTETIAEVLDGEVRLPPLRDEHRRAVARRRVLRVLNRGSKETLMALPGIGAARADAIIARREVSRLTDMEDVREVLPPAAVQALRDYALTRVGYEDEDDGAQALRKRSPA